MQIERNTTLLKEINAVHIALSIAKLNKLWAWYCTVLPPCKSSRNQTAVSNWRTPVISCSIGCLQVGVHVLASFSDLLHEIRSFTCLFGDVDWYKQRNTSSVLLWNGIILLCVCCGNDQGAWRELRCDVWHQRKHELLQSVHVIVSKIKLSTEYSAKEWRSIFVKVRDLPVTCHPVEAVFGRSCAERQDFT
jgi:hypothetical protein